MEKDYDIDQLIEKAKNMQAWSSKNLHQIRGIAQIVKEDSPNF